MIGGVYVRVCLGTVRLFVLVDDGGGSIFGETAEKVRQTGAGFVPTTARTLMTSQPGHTPFYGIFVHNQMDIHDFRQWCPL